MRLPSLIACALLGLTGLVACSEDAAVRPEACSGDACSKAPCGVDERQDADTGACIPLGWRDCPTGFVLDASGFECNEVLPAASPRPAA